MFFFFENRKRFEEMQKIAIRSFRTPFILFIYLFELGYENFMRFILVLKYQCFYS